MYYSDNTPDKQQKKPKNKEFFQKNPLWKEPEFPLNKKWKTKSKTSSLESYQKDAKKVCYAIRHNKRQPKSEIVFHLLKEFSVKELQDQWARMSRYLRSHITAFGCREITRDGTKKNGPTNRIHYHFLIADDLSEDRLKNFFTEAATKAKLGASDFRVDYRPIDNPEKKAFYFTKYKCKGVILFANKLGLQKYVKIGDYFLDKDENVSSIEKLWKPIKQIGKKIYEIKDQYPSYFAYIELCGIWFNFEQYKKIITRLDNGSQDLLELDRYYAQLEYLDIDEFEYYLKIEAEKFSGDIVGSTKKQKKTPSKSVSKNHSSTQKNKEMPDPNKKIKKKTSLRKPKTAKKY